MNEKGEPHALVEIWGFVFLSGEHNFSALVTVFVKSGMYSQKKFPLAAEPAKIEEIRGHCRSELLLAMIGSGNRRMG